MALKTYSKALDLLLCSVAFAKAGKPEKAAKAFADALDQEDFQPMVDGLSEQQQDMQDQGDDMGVDQDPQGWQDQDEQSFAKVLSRLTANTRSVTAGEDDQDDESSDDDSSSADAEEAGAGEFDGVPEGGDATDVTVEHADADDSDSDDDKGEASDDDKPAFLKKDESKVMESAKARLERANRIAANKAVIAKLKKKTK